MVAEEQMAKDAFMRTAIIPGIRLQELFMMDSIRRHECIIGIRHAAAIIH